MQSISTHMSGSLPLSGYVIRSYATGGRCCSDTILLYKHCHSIRSPISCHCARGKRQSGSPYRCRTTPPDHLGTSSWRHPIRPLILSARACRPNRGQNILSKTIIVKWRHTHTPRERERSGLNYGDYYLSWNVTLWERKVGSSL